MRVIVGVIRLKHFSDVVGVTSNRLPSHVMRKTENEILKLQEAGFYSDVDLGEPTGELDDIEKQKAEEPAADRKTRREEGLRCS